MVQFPERPKTFFITFFLDTLLALRRIWNIKLSSSQARCPEGMSFSSHKILLVLVFHLATSTSFPPLFLLFPSAAFKSSNLSLIWVSRIRRTNKDCFYAIMYAVIIQGWIASPASILIERNSSVSRIWFIFSKRQQGKENNLSGITNERPREWFGKSFAR